MSETNIIHVNIILNRSDVKKVLIPSDINEIELKAKLRDLGYISEYCDSCFSTKVYLDDNGKKEICTNQYRSLEQLGVKEGCYIHIVSVKRVTGQVEGETSKNNYGKRNRTRTRTRTKPRYRSYRPVISL